MALGEIMFGYIKVYKPEMKIKEYEVYKGIYCSLCKQLGKDYGLFSRMILNYDFTFLALCLMAINDDEIKLKNSHCTFCAMKKCLSCTTPDKTLEYSAAITIITAYYKILDNYNDGKITEKTQSALLLPYFKTKFKKANKKFPKISEIIRKQMESQKNVEKIKTDSIDIAADASSKAMGEIISSFFPEYKKNVLYRFGYCLGRFVYISDALDDLEKDSKNNSYNAFLSKSKDLDFKEIREKSFSILDTTADELAKAYELIDFHRFKPIIDNVIYYGLDLTINKVLRKEESQDEKSI